MKRNLRKALLLSFAIALGVMPSAASSNIYLFGQHGEFCYDSEDSGGYGPGLVCYFWY
jgi:hypothetical protein